MKLQNELSRLAWSCRRGMLELDVLLGNFLKEAYVNLVFSEKKSFEALLACHDTDLFTWLLGYQGPADTNLTLIVEKIRQHARSRLQG